jgi:diguanylate cyclase (GGDEF)-like protein/PAS domain S-box-containing protein
VSAGLLVSSLLAGGGGAIYATGGTRTSMLHVLYLGVLAGAWAFGVAGGVVAGVAAGLVAGPLMPLDVAAGVAQHPVNWTYRLGFFVLMGGVMGAGARTLGRQLRSLRASEDHFKSVVENTSDLLLVQVEDGTIQYASPSITRVLGYPPGHMRGTSLDELLHPGDSSALRDRWSGEDTRPEQPSFVEVRARHRDGDWRHLEVSVTDLRDNPSVRGILLGARDVTARRTMEGQLIHLALHDRLTGLANRTLFTERLDRDLSATRDQPVAVMVISLERMRAVRDSYGHEAGDRVMCAVADRLQSRLRAEDVLSRNEGNEFAMACPGVGDHRDALEIARRTLDAIREPLLVTDQDEVYVSASIGVAVSTAPHDADGLLRDAYTAMRKAVGAGGNRCELFSIRWRAEAVSRLKTHSALHRALERGELRLHYQPIVRLADRRISSLEALLRWQHPSFGLVPPAEFIPIAEQTGVIVPIGEWVLREATAQLRDWQRSFGSCAPDRVAVNLSPVQLDRDDLTAVVEDVLRTSELPAACLDLEVTESLLVDDDDRRERLVALKGLGVGLGIDDFGTGYSSLGYLQEIPADTLKIDRAFVRDIGPSSDDPIVTAVIGLAHRLGLGTVAEGVETAQQAAKLQACGCDEAQGFWFARPQDAEGVAALLGTSRDAHSSAPT